LAFQVNDAGSIPARRSTPKPAKNSQNTENSRVSRGTQARIHSGANVRIQAQVRVRRAFLSRNCPAIPGAKALAGKGAVNGEATRRFYLAFRAAGRYTQKSPAVLFCAPVYREEGIVKISELIAKLEEIKHEHGDLETYCTVESGWACEYRGPWVSAIDPASGPRLFEWDDDLGEPSSKSNPDSKTVLRINNI
jgi:hypothetical protein